MNIALVIVGGMLTLMSALSSVFQLLKQGPAMEMKVRVGLSDAQLKIVALLKLAGATGLVVGIWNTDIGILASACLALFFVGAIFAELRKKAKGADLAPVIVFTILAIVVTWLQLQR